MKNQKSGLFVPPNIKPFPFLHELDTARVLANNGYYVEFLLVDNRTGAKSPDIKLNGEVFELKSPLGRLDSVERNLKRASKQSRNIVFDCRRMKVKNTDRIKQILIRKLKTQKQIQKILFITRFGKIIDINSLI
jgi:hypothetical protein